MLARDAARCASVISRLARADRFNIGAAARAKREMTEAQRAAARANIVKLQAARNPETAA